MTDHAAPPIGNDEPAPHTAWLTARARGLGFDAIGVTPVNGAPEAGPRLMAFLAAGAHGTMDWMATHADRRADPQVLWPEARSVIMLGVNYGPQSNPLDALALPQQGVISVYAQRRDYHDVIKSGLKVLAGELVARAGGEVKVFVDTAPLMEKPLAAAAGLGWQGKHTNLVSRAFGSWLFLGAILTTLDLRAARSETDHCGRCTRCLDACPTRAFPAPYQLDARRCLAYLSIEYKGTIDVAFRRPMGNRVFGCDDCLAVCPWNKFAQATSQQKLALRDDLGTVSLAELLALDDATFRQRFAGTPIKRTGRDRVVRNALIAAGNAADPQLCGAVIALLSDRAPIVRAMAVWALTQIADAETVERHRQRLSRDEADRDVLTEWARAGDDPMRSIRTSE